MAKPIGEMLGDLLDRELAVANAAADRAERCLDAVPDPVDSAAPAAMHLPGCAPIVPDAVTTRHRRPR